MSSSHEFIEFVCEQIYPVGNITYRKMFGEYALYCDGKVFALVCDNQFFVKITDAGKAILPNLNTGKPYKNASDYFLISDFDDTELLCLFISRTVSELPIRIKKQKKKHLKI